MISGKNPARVKCFCGRKQEGMCVGTEEPILDEALFFIFPVFVSNYR